MDTINYFMRHISHDFPHGLLLTPATFQMLILLKSLSLAPLPLSYLSPSLILPISFFFKPLLYRLVTLLSLKPYIPLSLEGLCLGFYG